MAEKVIQIKLEQQGPNGKNKFLWQHFRRPGKRNQTWESQTFVVSQNKKTYKLLLYGWKQKTKKTTCAKNVWKREWKYFNHLISKMLELNTDSSR